MPGKTNARSQRRSGTSSLEQEQALYHKNLSRWLEQHEHTHVLIKGAIIAGFYETREEALAAGYERFGVVPLFVKQVEASEPVYHIPNVLL